MIGPLQPRRFPLCIALVLAASVTGSAWGQLERPDGEEPVEAAVEGGLETAAGGDVDVLSEHAADEHHAADPHAIDYNKPPLPPSPGMLTLFIYSLVLFGLFLLLARTFAWLPLIRALDQREARVNQAYADADAARHEAERLLGEYDAKLQEARDKVTAIVAAARREAEQQKAEIIAGAEAEAHRLREEAIAEIHRARDEAEAHLERTIEAQVALATEHVIGHPVG
jgi:F-type H+-transporting ATPase subunit b